MRTRNCRGSEINAPLHSRAESRSRELPTHLEQEPLFKQGHLSTHSVLRRAPTENKTCSRDRCQYKREKLWVFKADKPALPFIGLTPSMPEPSEAEEEGRSRWLAPQMC